MARLARRSAKASQQGRELEFFEPLRKGAKFDGYGFLCQNSNFGNANPTEHVGGWRGGGREDKKCRWRPLQKELAGGVAAKGSLSDDFAFCRHDSRRRAQHAAHSAWQKMAMALHWHWHRPYYLLIIIG